MADRRLLEDGSSLRLLEDGSSKRLLESDGDTKVVLTTGASWTLPADIDVTKPLVAIAIGSGGGGAHGTFGVGGGGAGGGGAWARSELDVSALTPGSTPIYTSFGAAGTGGASDGADGTDGGDVWVNKAANSAPTLTSNGVVAKGGKGGESNSPSLSGVTVDYAVSETWDDAYQQSVSINAGASFVLYGGGSYWAAVRFGGVDVPNAAPIISATLTLYSDDWSSSTSNLGNWYGDKQADAPVWSFSDLPSAVAKTTALVAANGIGGFGNAFTRDFTAIVQELVDQPGWASGNGMRFVVDPTGAANTNSFVSFESGNASLYPKISIAYAADGPGGGGQGGASATSIGTWKWPGANGASASGAGGSAGRHGTDANAGDGGATGTDGADYGGGGGGGAETGAGGDGAPGVIVLRYFATSGASPDPIYKGAVGASIYRGERSEAQLYRGARDLFA